MRKITISLAGTEIDLVANFAASIELNDKVRDPLEIMKFAALDHMFAEKGIAYTPPWQFSVKNIPIILHIGAKAAKSELTLEEMQNLCFEAGYLESQAEAVHYVASIVGPTAEVEVPEPAGAKPKKKKAGRGSDS